MKSIHFKALLSSILILTGCQTPSGIKQNKPDLSLYSNIECSPLKNTERYGQLRDKLIFNMDLDKLVFNGKEINKDKYNFTFNTPTPDGYIFYRVSAYKHSMVGYADVVRIEGNMIKEVAYSKLRCEYK